jgi:hypothetical protein
MFAAPGAAADGEQEATKGTMNFMWEKGDE